MSALKTFPPKMRVGETYCTRCDRDKLPDGDWLGEGHMAIREWQRENNQQRCLPDERAVWRIQSEKLTIFIDGVHQPYVYEFDAGPNGWAISAIKLDDPIWFEKCQRCFDGILVYITIGDVRVGERQAREDAA